MRSFIVMVVLIGVISATGCSTTSRATVAQSPPQHRESTIPSTDTVPRQTVEQPSELKEPELLESLRFVGVIALAPVIVVLAIPLGLAYYWAHLSQ